ncbi:Vms1/Ankzf1 family peptidyl-tRNA hydrolase [Amycolatopsis palatopharyngis]|uniref:Rv2629 family ribosome hibernation factor n=1 Tax=Amycolatopsis palatopharyngis TaxID=187982 RepID=UPI000E237520|nr:Vms1/Ankzf1 family peptidyl-tRNA hydrolase [Amycolatopsis palatopharyngis]
MQTTGFRDLVNIEGPFDSVYFEDTYQTEDAEKQLELKWRELRERLSEQGASESTLDALDSAVRQGERPVGQGGRALIAANDQILLDRHLQVPPAFAEARHSELPFLLPLARYGEVAPPHVVVVVDSVGAEITAVDRFGSVVAQRTTEGREHPVHAVTHAGQVMAHLQEHVDEIIKHNINDVAEEVAKLTQSTGAQLVIVAGEVQSRTKLHEALPEQARRLATEVESGTRASGSDPDQLRAAVREVVGQARRARLDDVVDRFRAEEGRDQGLAAQGLRAVAAALRERKVDTLLVGDVTTADVLIGPDLTQIATKSGELAGSGGAPATSRRADEALVVAAVATGADLVDVHDRLELTDGVGALLRHT